MTLAKLYEDVSKQKIRELSKNAMNIRKTILTMIHTAQSGHPGGSLSLADIFAVLYFDLLKIDPQDPNLIDRDRVVLSKGHACPVLYSSLALRGYFPYETIYTLRQLGSILQGHPDMRKVPGVDMTTGSLGQGLSIAVGMAFSLRFSGINSNVYAILGDGELDEGQIWEAAMLASKLKLNKLIAIIDYNDLQLDGRCSEVMPIEPLEDKWKDFGWRTIKMDGHDIEDILLSLHKAKLETEKPVCAIANTVKGKGVDFMENQCNWHGKAPNDEEFDSAIKQVMNSYEESTTDSRHS